MRWFLGRYSLIGKPNSDEDESKCQDIKESTDIHRIIHILSITPTETACVLFMYLFIYFYLYFCLHFFNLNTK